jgi:1,4-alpha-glucan branching enzyme
MQRLIRDLNTLYRDSPALHARDCEGEGFQWLIADDHENSVFAWARHSGGQEPPVLVVSNFTPVPRHGYAVPAPRAGRWAERVNTDAAAYGGSDTGNMGEVQTSGRGQNGMPASLTLTLPPLATLILQFAGP